MCRALILLLTALGFNFALWFAIGRCMEADHAAVGAVARGLATELLIGFEEESWYPSVIYFCPGIEDQLEDDSLAFFRSRMAQKNIQVVLLTEETLSLSLQPEPMMLFCFDQEWSLPMLSRVYVGITSGDHGGAGIGSFRHELVVYVFGKWFVVHKTDVTQRVW